MENKKKYRAKAFWHSPDESYQADVKVSLVNAPFLVARVSFEFTSFDEEYRGVMVRDAQGDRMRGTWRWANGRASGACDAEVFLNEVQDEYILHGNWGEDSKYTWFLHIISEEA